MSQLSIMIIIPNKQRFLRNVYNIRWMGLIIETTLKSAQACFILPWLVSSIWLKTMVSVSPRPNLRSDQCLAAIIFYRLPQLAPAGEWMPRPGQPTLLQSCKASEHGWQVWQEGRESLWAAKRQKLVEMARLFHSNSIYCYFFCTQHSQAEHYEWQALNDAQLQEDSLQYRFWGVRIPSVRYRWLMALGRHPGMISPPKNAAMEILFFRSLQNILPAQVVHSPEKEPQASSAEVAHMWSWKQVQFFFCLWEASPTRKRKASHDFEAAILCIQIWVAAGLG